MHVSVLYAVFAPHPETSRSTSYTALLMENLCFRSSFACSDSKAYNFTKKQTKKLIFFTDENINIICQNGENLYLLFTFQFCSSFKTSYFLPEPTGFFIFTV